MARLDKHKQTARCYQATDMRSKQMDFSLYSIEVGELVEGVAHFKYLIRPLYQSDNNWLSIHQNIRREPNVWGQLVKVPLQEG